MNKLMAVGVRFWILIGMLMLGGGEVAISYMVVTINTREEVQALQARLSAQAGEQFIRAFVQQQDYICEVLTARTAPGGDLSGQGLPRPPSGLCTVKAP